MAAVIKPDFAEIPWALLLLVELARYLRAEAAPNTVEVDPSSLISMTMAPEVTIVCPAAVETPVETEETTIPDWVEVEVEVEVEVTVSVLAVLDEFAREDNWLMKLVL